MRTTLDIDDDVLLATKELARREKRTAGEIISDLTRRALSAPETGIKRKMGAAGFRPFASRGVVVTNARINQLRNESGV